MNLHTANRHHQAAIKRANRTAIGKNRWKGPLRKTMEKEVRKMKRKV